LEEEGNPCQRYPFFFRTGCLIRALTGIQIANKKALQAASLEGLHPVFLTLFMWLWPLSFAEWW